VSNPGQAQGRLWRVANFKQKLRLEQDQNQNLKGAVAINSL